MTIKHREKYGIEILEAMIIITQSAIEMLMDC